MFAINDTERSLCAQFVDRRRALILQLQESKGIKASGLSAQLLRTEQQGNLTQLIDAAGYFEQEEFGRGPGSMPPFQFIYDWLAFKKYGFNWKDEKQRRSMAWAIMIKIRQRGTHTFIQRRPTGVLSEAINSQMLDELIRELADNKSSEIKTDISRLNIG